MTHWKKYFPFPSIRDEQEKAIDFALQAYDAGKKFVILELGTGVGKSAIAMALARYLAAERHSSSYVLTTQKVLQEQYMRDFAASGLKLLKSAGSYTCRRTENLPIRASCREVQSILKTKSEARRQFLPCQSMGCRYLEAKQEFFESPEGITNYAYFLATNAYSYQKIPKREFLILDEGHNIEDVVSNFVTISFSNHFYKNVLGVRVPAVTASQAEVFKWLTETCAKKLRKKLAEYKKQLEDMNEESPDAVELSKTVDDLEQKQQQIYRFKDNYGDGKEWVLDVSKTDKRGERRYEFKPINVSTATNRLLFDYADKVLILSATIIDLEMFCSSTGIPVEDVAYLRTASPFPIENRPVHYVPVGSMSKKNIDVTLPVMVAAVDEILKQHPNEKGIIHCVNYRIANEIEQKLKNPRLLKHESSDREEVLKRHKESPEPTVLVSPSMTEGVDLADDASRFQIICKIPFPYLGDVAVKRKTELNQRWYSYQTVKTIVQSLGRSIRNENDHAVSYILDADWQRFYRTNSRMFPPDFDKTLRQ